MKRIIVILFFLFNYGYSYDIYLYKYNNDYYKTVYTVNGIDWSSSLCAVGDTYVIDGTTRYSATPSDFPTYDSNFVSCVNYYVTFKCSDSPVAIYSITIDNYNYCLNNYSGNTFSSGYFIDSNNNIICPDGQTYNYDTEQCEDIPECPTTDELDQQAIQKCGSLDFVEYESCNPDTGEVTITCKSCSDVISLLQDYCQSNYDSNISDFNCSGNPDGSLTLSATEFNSSLCLISDSEPTDTNVTDSDNTSTTDTNTTSTDTNTTDTSSDSTSDSSTSDTDSNTDSSTSDNYTCPDPCSIYKDVGVQVTSSTVGDYVCFTITYPTYGDDCILKYHTSDNTQAGPNCVAGCDDSSTTSVTNNVTTATVTVDVSGVEERLDSINQKLDDFKNMTPDSNFTVDGSDSDTDSFISQFGEFFNNVGDDITKIKDSFSQVSGMLNEDNYKLTAFNSDATTCPISATIFGKDFNVDFCSFILPFRPLLSIFFTVVFNFLVIKYFLKLVISKEDK